MAVSKRTVIRVLTRARLLEVAAKAGHDGLTGKRKEEIVQALASSRRVALVELLAHYSRDELKSACEAAGLSTKGREKALIVNRLLGVGAAHSDAKPVPKKTPERAVTKPMSQRSIRHYDHPDKKRPNNPPVGLVTPETDPPVPARKTYAYDPHLDPALQFDNAGADVERILNEALAAEDLEPAKQALQELRRRREPYRGVRKRFRPDFLIPLANGTMLVLETKGQDTDENRTKRRFLDEWGRAVNEHGGFGHWNAAVALDLGAIHGVLEGAALLPGTKQGSEPTSSASAT